jgi:protein-S-isoprenylcysteine O-methyltransferase Ste14
MTEQEQQTPGIRLIPPLVYAVSLLIGLAIEQLLPLVSIPGTWRAGPAVILIALAGLLIAPTVMRFRKADTPFSDFSKPATTLITDGPYRYSRNPGYLALTLLYLGVGVLFRSAWVCFLVVPTLLIINVAVVRKEEQHLESQFGEEYLRYKTAVRRWL